MCAKCWGYDSLQNRQFLSSCNSIVKVIDLNQIMSYTNNNEM